MAIKTFKFNYDNYNAEVHFNVDTDVFTHEMVMATLEFYLWDYDEDNDIVTEVLIKYAMEAIKTATFYSFNLRGVIRHFDDLEGFAKVDGSLGITLTYINGYTFIEDKLAHYVTTNE